MLMVSAAVRGTRHRAGHWQGPVNGSRVLDEREREHRSGTQACVRPARFPWASCRSVGAAGVGGGVRVLC